MRWRRSPRSSAPRRRACSAGHERVDILHAALFNGMTSHTFDFDDTHLKTVIHPAGPVASAILALAEYMPVTGAEFLHAFVLGVEVECRIGNAVYPSHYDIGWHITGTAGVFGAAAAAGKLLGLSEPRLVWALGIAATQAAGLREMFGSMCKPLHPGMAAKNGLYAALLAQQDFTSTNVGIEGKRGFANVLATERDYEAITGRLGETWELAENTYKPFACGIVIHPTIDGCIQLRNEHHLQPEDIERIDVTVHPLVLELTGKKTPARRTRGQVQRLSLRSGRGHRRRRRRGAVLRRARRRSARHGAARPRARRRRSGHARGRRRRAHHAARWKSPVPARRCTRSAASPGR